MNSKNKLPLYFTSEDSLHLQKYCADDLSATSCNDLIDAISPNQRLKYIQDLLTSLEKSTTFCCLFNTQNTQGKIRTMRDFGRQIKTPDGENIFLIVRSDVTCYEKKLEELEAKVKELEEFASNIPGGVCQVEQNSQFTLINGNDGFYSLYGYTREQLEKEQNNNLENIVLEQDRQYVLDVLEKFRLSQSPVFEFEHRIIQRNGTIIWVLVRGSFGQYKGKSMFNCVVIDITKRKKVEDAARINERRFRIALSQTDKSIFEYNIADKIMIHGDRSAETYGLGTVTANMPYSLIENGTIHTDTSADFLEMYRCIDNGAPSASCLIKTRLSTGNYVWRKITMSTIFDENDRPVQAIGFLEDVDEQIRRENELLYQSERDPLTGLYNRRALIEKIRSSLSDGSRGSISAMIIIDIDNFKSVNDTYGHMFGDYVLSESAKRVLSLFRKEELIGRIGGDEFMAFISDLPSESVAFSCADRIAQTYSADFADHGYKTSVSCSIGVATFPMYGKTFEALYQNADIALYEAKRRGKNQVLAFTPDINPQDDWKPYPHTDIENTN